MIYKKWIGVAVGLILVMGGCGMVEEPVENTPITEVHNEIIETFNLLDNLSIQSNTAAGTAVPSIIQGFNTNQTSIKAKFNEVMSNLCLAGVLPIDRDENSYPVNGIYTFSIDSNIAETIQRMCDNRFVSAVDTVTITVQDTSSEMNDTYVKHLIVDLGEGAIIHYDIRHNNSNINILMTETQAESNTQGYDYRTIIDYDPKNNILKSEFIEILDTSNNNNVYFFRTYIDSNKSFVAFYDDNAIYSAAASNSRYELNTDEKNWYDSQASCVNKGGCLASILDTSTLSDLASKCSEQGSTNALTYSDLLTSSDCWIGLNDIDNEGDYKWAGPESATDYSAINYTDNLELYWTDGRDCFNLEKIYTWNKVEGQFCTEIANYICEYPIGTETAISYLDIANNESSNKCINRTTGNDGQSFPCGASTKEASVIQMMINNFDSSAGWIESKYKLSFDGDSIFSNSIR